MDLTHLLQSQLSDNMIEQLSRQIGGADKKATAKASTGIVSVLMAAMARNASSPEGARSLDQALSRDHDGSILDNLTGMLSGRSAGPENSRTLNGTGILKHVLGGKQSGAVEMISGMSGLDSNKTGMLMTLLAPVVMGMLGKAKQQNNLDAGGISDLLSGFSGAGSKTDNPAMGMISSFLDKDGDGSVMDDVAGMGMKMLGGFFKK